MTRVRLPRKHDANPCGEAGETRPRQCDLFEHVAAVYADSPNGQVSNQALYQQVADRAGLSTDERQRRIRVGKTGDSHSALGHQVRWIQQALKKAGVLQRVASTRGVWELAEPNKSGLHVPVAGASLVAFSTRLGVAVWGDCFDVLRNFAEPIHLAVTSPPYALRRARAYGNPSPVEYVDFLIAALEPIVRNLVPGGSIVLNVSPNSFDAGMPSRTLVLERLSIALHDKLGLHKMDSVIWMKNSPPGPAVWSCQRRVQLNQTYEVALWFTNAPDRVRADNRRVLIPHTGEHKKLMAAGGERRTAAYGDGSFRLREGSFGNVTAGRIPRNVMSVGNRCADSDQYRRDAQRLGLPVHGAMSPLSIPKFFIRFLTEENELVVDFMAGTAKAAMAAERTRRRWFIVERVLDYLRADAERFRVCDGFYMPESVETWPRAA